MVSACMVALGALLSTAWILDANSWMQTPSGYREVNGQFQPVNWLHAIFNPAFNWRFPHMVLAVLVAVPLGYLLSRTEFPGKRLLNVVLDIPVVLPPLVVGLSLLILFQTLPARFFEKHFFAVTYAVPSVILAQFSVAAAFAVRVTQAAFMQMTPRSEQVAMTLGCSRAQAFFKVVLPEGRRAVVAAFAIAWARSLGEFGPVLVFSGATRMRTEVLSTTVFLELSVGRLDAAVAVSLLMVIVAVAVLLLLQGLGRTGDLDRTVPR